MVANKILEVEGLVTRFMTGDGVVHAVNGVSLDVYEGETLGIVGESGCGKTVSMLSVIRLLPQPPAMISAGRIYFQGEDILGAPEKRIRELRGSRIAMIFQDPMTSLNPVLTVGLQVMEPLQYHLHMSGREARDRACELLHLVGIPDARTRLDDYPHQFSGGMRQRAMIAMALTCNPTLLIADEPTTALDVTIQAQIVDLVKHLRDRFGMALIWITHDLGVIAGLADRVNVMYAGFVTEAGPIDLIYEAHQHPYTAALLRSLPSVESRVAARLESIEGLPPDLRELPTGCPFAPRCRFTKDRCRTQNPPLEERGPGHRVACWVDLESGELR